MPFNDDSFYEHYKWDSIFKTTYNILELEEKNNQFFATVASKSIRNEFLKKQSANVQVQNLIRIWENFKNRGL
tara:strand:- start:28 stop:246 length:219 start_codon:yes stop_codon:yes gene_type:complete